MTDAASIALAATYLLDRARTEWGRREVTIHT